MNAALALPRMRPVSPRPIVGCAVLCAAAILAAVLPARLAAQDAPAPPAAAPSPASAPGGAQHAASATPSPLLPEDKHFQRPKILQRVPIAYPVLANLNRVEGVVRIRFSVDEAGHVSDVAALRREESLLLDDIVRDPRLRLWTFQPATLDGKPVPASFEQEFEFRLDPAEQRAIALRRPMLPVGTPDPPYPEAAKARQLRGSCTVLVQWSKKGFVDRILLATSTNSLLLDETAVRFAYEHWRINPAKVTNETFTKTIHFEPPP